MEFFNKKEDVLDIELTPFGELLLSKGKFKPEYYAFFDDGVLYDSSYANVTEIQNETKKRIKEVPRLKTQYQFRGGEFPKHITQEVVMELPGQEITPAPPGTYGLDVVVEQKVCRIALVSSENYLAYEAEGFGTSFHLEGNAYFSEWMTQQEKDELFNALVEATGIAPKTQCDDVQTTTQGEYIPDTPTVFRSPGIITEHQYPHPVFAANALPLPLGLCDYDTGFAPAWDLRMLYGEITGSVEMSTSSMHPYLKIPQVNIDVVYESYIGPSIKTTKPDTSKYKLRAFQEIHDNRHIYPDGTSIYFDEDCIVLEINEEHVPFLKENFDIEVFKIEKNQEVGRNVEEELIPLSFLKPVLTLVDEKGLLKNLDEQLIAQEQELQLQLQDLDNSFVEHYFNIWIDSDIDNNLMCKVKPTVKKKGLFITDPAECKNEQQSDFSINSVYGPSQEDTIPECDE